MPHQQHQNTKNNTIKSSKKHQVNGTLQYSSVVSSWQSTVSMEVIRNLQDYIRNLQDYHR